MESGACDALVLAFAGVHRLGYDHLMVQELPPQHFVPPAGQGSITLEATNSLKDSTRDSIRDLVNHPESELCIRAERSFLRTMQGGCSVPIFSLAHRDGKDLVLTAGIISLDGQEIISETVFSPEDPEILGEKLALKVLGKGGAKILEQVKSQLGN